MKGDVMQEKAPRGRSKNATARIGTYVYAIVPVSDGRSYDVAGINGVAVYSIPAGCAAAIVSDVPNEKIRPERLHLAAHQEVLKHLLPQCAAVLPMSFGIIADGADAVRKILSRNQQLVAEQLRTLSGKVEMTMRVKWDVPNIFEYFVKSHPELGAARDQYLALNRNPTHEDKIRIGQMFESMLGEDRETCTKTVEDAISRSCFAIKRNRCSTEHDVMNLACLVGREAVKDFETGVFDAARLFDNNFAFDYNGPWVPYSFVTINLER